MKQNSGSLLSILGYFFFLFPTFLFLVYRFLLFLVNFVCGCVTARSLKNFFWLEAFFPPQKNFFGGMINRNSPKYSGTLNFRTPIFFCKNNLFFVPDLGQLEKFLSLNFRTRNYDALEVQQRSAMIN